MANRFTAGFKIYQKGHVKLLKQENQEFYEFEVKGSNHNVYKTEFDLKEGTVRCHYPGCPDYGNRAKFADGSFVCKHIVASFFKLAEIMGVGSQVALDVQVKGAVES